MANFSYTYEYNGQTYTFELPEIVLPYQNIDLSGADYGQRAGYIDYKSQDFKAAIDQDYFKARRLLTYETIKGEIDLYDEGKLFLFSDQDETMTVGNNFDGTPAIDRTKFYQIEKAKIEKSVANYKAQADEIAAQQPAKIIELVVAKVAATGAIAPPPFGLIAIGVSTLFQVIGGSEQVASQERQLNQLLEMQTQIVKLTDLYNSLTVDLLQMGLLKELKVNPPNWFEENKAVVTLMGLLLVIAVVAALIRK